MWDPESQTKAGDILMIRPFTDRYSAHIRATHELQEVLFPSGYIIDPVSGRRCRGLEFMKTNEVQTYTDLKMKP